MNVLTSSLMRFSWQLEYDNVHARFLSQSLSLTLKVLFFMQLLKIVLSTLMSE